MRVAEIFGIPIVVDRLGPPDAFVFFDAGWTPDYPSGLVLVSPTAWAFACAIHLADAYRPEGLPLELEI